MADSTDRDDLTESAWLGVRLKEARESLGLPQSAVADHLAIPRPSVSDMESGRRKVAFLELKRLAALYRKPLQFFLDEEADVEADETFRALYRTTAELSSEDQTQLLRFAQFLREAGPARPPSVREEGQ